MTTIRAGQITYQSAPFVMRSELSATKYIQARIKLGPDEVAEILRKRATLSCGYTLEDAPFVVDARLDYGEFAEPLVAIGPVQSGTLREVKRGGG